MRGWRSSGQRVRLGMQSVVRWITRWVHQWQWVRVSGPSMVPTLRHGDLVLVRKGVAVRAGHVVLARFRDMPDRLVIKRAQHPVEDGWWLASDNSFAGGDSRTHGIADVCATAVLRLRGFSVRRGPQFIKQIDL